MHCQAKCSNAWIRRTVSVPIMPMPTYVNAKRHVYVVQVSLLGGKGLGLQRCKAYTEHMYSHRKLDNHGAMTLSKLALR